MSFSSVISANYTNIKKVCKDFIDDTNWCKGSPDLFDLEIHPALKNPFQGASIDLTGSSDVYYEQRPLLKVEELAGRIQQTRRIFSEATEKLLHEKITQTRCVEKLSLIFPSTRWVDDFEDIVSIDQMHKIDGLAAVILLRSVANDESLDLVGRDAFVKEVFGLLKQAVSRKIGLFITILIAQLHTKIIESDVSSATLKQVNFSLQEEQYAFFKTDHDICLVPGKRALFSDLLHEFIHTLQLANIDRSFLFSLISKKSFLFSNFLELLTMQPLDSILLSEGVVSLWFEEAQRGSHQSLIPIDPNASLEVLLGYVNYVMQHHICPEFLLSLIEKADLTVEQRHTIGTAVVSSLLMELINHYPVSALDQDLPPHSEDLYVASIFNAIKEFHKHSLLKDLSLSHVVPLLDSASLRNLFLFRAVHSSLSEDQYKACLNQAMLDHFFECFDQDEFRDHFEQVLSLNILNVLDPKTLGEIFKLIAGSSRIKNEEVADLLLSFEVFNKLDEKDVKTALGSRFETAEANSLCEAWAKTLSE